MRIISGTYRGKRLTAPKNLPVRPTTDMAKEGLFNILANRYFFGELKVVDLFAGTGNISYEFASRGTPEIIAVDAHYGCLKFIDETASQLEFPIRTVKSDAIVYLEQAKPKADIIFADPPYAMEVEQMERMVNSIIDNGLLPEDGLFILEHSKHTDLSHLPHLLEERKYGGSIFSFFGKE